MPLPRSAVPDYAVPNASILVVAKHQALATLMLGMAELSGREATRPRDDEHPVDAVERVRPALVLLDCQHPAARADEFYQRAQRAGTRVLLFNSMHTPREAELIAARRGARAVTLPLRPREFDAELRQTLGS